MYLKLINSNVKKTLQDYQIYIITLVVSSALFFSFISLSSPCNTIIADGTKYSDAMFRQTINLTVGLVSLIFFVLVNYVNNHMIKRGIQSFLGSLLFRVFRSGSSVGSFSRVWF